MSAALMIPAQHKRALAAAPQHPPCFDSQSEWVEYVAWSLAAGEYSMNPLARGRSVYAKRLIGFNPRFNYCTDCSTEYRAAMRRAGRCDPDWVASRAQQEPRRIEIVDISARGAP